MNSPDVSVVIPVYNRGDLIRYTLESVRRATSGLVVETIVVDDGSENPVREDLDRLGYAAEVIRQENQGLLFARLTGLAAARGRYVLFLDSDDLIASDKLQRQVRAMDNAGTDVSYSDVARVELTGAYDDLRATPDAPLRATTDAADFFLNIQPAPHSPIFRTDYIQRIVRQPAFRPSPLYNPVAEIWFYHNAALQPGRTLHVPGAFAIIGAHPGGRLTGQWERLAVASLAVMEAFARTALPSAGTARRFVGEKAFRSWRRLPRDFSPPIGDRLLGIWRRLAADPVNLSALGGGLFQGVSRLVGPVRAGRLFQRWQNATYGQCRNVSDTELSRLLAQLPPP